jgi:hypothetical protein
MSDDLEMRKKLGIPVGANVTLIDMDANPDKFEHRTAGWTDLQILGKSKEELELMVKQASMVEETLRKNWEDQQIRVGDLRMILNRRITLRPS